MIADKAIKVDKITLNWIDKNRQGIPRGKFLRMYLVDGNTIKLINK